MNLNDDKLSDLNHYLSEQISNLMELVPYHRIYHPLYVTLYASLIMNLQHKIEAYEFKEYSN
jgi:Na+-translocating ferredoxin:NAD+ oxidoreductase RnfE subunit